MVEQERKKVAQLPVHSIGHIFCFGNVLVSPFLLGFCGENNVNLAFFYGKRTLFGAASGPPERQCAAASGAVSGVGAKSRADYAKYHCGKDSGE